MKTSLVATCSIAVTLALMAPLTARAQLSYWSGGITAEVGGRQDGIDCERAGYGGVPGDFEVTCGSHTAIGATAVVPGRQITGSYRLFAYHPGSLAPNYSRAYTSGPDAGIQFHLDGPTRLRFSDELEGSGFQNFVSVGFVNWLGNPVAISSGSGTLLEPGFYTLRIVLSTAHWSWANGIIEYDFTLEVIDECNDGVDNDLDGRADFAGIDTNGDGYFGDPPDEFPPDAGCDSDLDSTETNADVECDDGIDNDGDGLMDRLDPTCANELGPEATACQDGLDGDGDGLTDWDGGESIHGLCENGVCPPGVSDVDGDGVADADPRCAGQAWWVTEGESRCGLGAEVAPLLALLGALRSRRSRRISS